MENEAVQQASELPGWASEEAVLKPGDVWTASTDPPLRGVAPIPFRPLHNQVVIRVLREQDRIGSIFIPDSHNDNKQHAAVGVVIAKGIGHRRKSRSATIGPNPQRQWLGGYCELPVEPGDHVVFARSSGEAHKLGDETFLVTPVEHIFCVLEDYDSSDKIVATEREFGLEAHLDKAFNRPASERPRVSGSHHV